MFYVAVVGAVVVGILALYQLYELFLTWRDRDSYDIYLLKRLQVVSDIWLLSEQNPHYSIIDKRLFVGHERAMLSVRVDKMIKAGHLHPHDRLLFDQLCEQIWGNVYFTELPERLIPQDGTYRAFSGIKGAWMMAPSQQRAAVRPPD